MVATQKTVASCSQLAVAAQAGGAKIADDNAELGTTTAAAAAADVQTSTCLSRRHTTETHTSRGGPPESLKQSISHTQM